MKAVVIRTPNRAFFRDEADPKAGEGQVLVKVAAAGVCMSDVEVMRGTRPAPYVKYPIIPGHEWCGTVERVGAGVKRVSVGDRVAVEGHTFCRDCAWCSRGETNLCASYNELGFTLPGGFAEYVAVRADLAHPFTKTLAFEAAALVEPFACVVHGAQRARVQREDTVAVVGPGTIGLLAVGWAALSRPARLVAVGLDRSNEATARKMGATDFLTVGDDPAATVREMTGGAGADTFALPNVMGHDEVTNFGIAKDTLGFNAALFANFAAAMTHASQVGANTVFTIDGADSVTLDNVTKSNLTGANFHLS